MIRGVLFSVLLVAFSSSSAFALAIDGTVWNVVSKKCGKETVAVGSDETYHFPPLGPGFVQVRVSMDTAERRCKEALAFNRLVTSFFTTGSEYSETSTVSSTFLRTVCRGKLNGIVDDEPYKDVTEPVSTQTTLLLKISADLTRAKKATIQISGSGECKTGVPLKVELKLKPTN